MKNYISIKFSNGEIFHLSEKHYKYLQSLGQEDIKFMIWEDIKQFCTRVSGEPFDYNLSTAEINIKEIKE